MLPADRRRHRCDFGPAVGTGNGQLLFAFSAAGYTSLTGIDYSPLSIRLANDILQTRAAPDSEHELSDPPPRFFVADVLDAALGRDVPGVTGERWDLITDKGTYDAVCLSDETREGKSLRELYVESVARLLPSGGIFLITSCEPGSGRTLLRLVQLLSPRDLQATGHRRSWKRPLFPQRQVR